MKKIKLCKTLALTGIIIMGIGSFMACLSTNSNAVFAGNIMLVLSIAMTAYGFTFWQP